MVFSSVNFEELEMRDAGENFGENIFNLLMKIKLLPCAATLQQKIDKMKKTLDFIVFALD